MGLLRQSTHRLLLIPNVALHRILANIFSVKQFGAAVYHNSSVADVTSKVHSKSVIGVRQS